MASKLIKFLTFQEVAKLIRATPKRELKLAIALGAGSGLRISEIVGNKKGIPALTEDNVDLDAKTIRIINAKGGKDRITTTSPWLNKSNIKLLPIKMPIRTLQWHFVRLSNKTLGKKCNFHMLRHSFGNYMVNEKNVPISIVQTLMGHSRLDTTGIYTRANPQQAIKKVWEEAF